MFLQMIYFTLHFDLILQSDLYSSGCILLMTTMHTLLSNIDRQILNFKTEC